MIPIIESIEVWFNKSLIEIIATVIALISIYFTIKEKTFFWILSLISSILFFIVYMKAKLYGYMSLQVYYFAISLYGLYQWEKGSKNEAGKMPITTMKLKEIIIFFLIFIIIFLITAFFMAKYTNSSAPIIDSFTSVAFILAAYLLTKKYLETWYIWIFGDIIAMAMLINQKLYAAAFLQFFYWIFAFIGYFEWKKSLQKQQKKA